MACGLVRSAITKEKTAEGFFLDDATVPATQASPNAMASGFTGDCFCYKK